MMREWIMFTSVIGTAYLFLQVIPTAVGQAVEWYWRRRYRRMGELPDDSKV